MLVRDMELSDVLGLAQLFQEMQAHYKVACPTTEKITADLVELPTGVTILVAGDPVVVGFTAVSTIYPGPGLNPGLFLKELFVSATVRGGGVGTALMRAVTHLTVERGLSRVDWTADRSNERLLGFYGAVGAVEQSEKVFLRLSGEALTRFAGQ